MESYLLDWANLLLRWVHVITAIAWIGSSFYFVFLDSSLTPPVDEDLKKQGVSGELWAVHGGGFYHPVKFAVRRRSCPSTCTGSTGRATAPGSAAFAVHRVLPVERRHLPDRQILMDWSPGAAIAVALVVSGGVLAAV
jgi:hypothetical protein